MGGRTDGVKQVEVKFGSGHEVLGAYWGFLSDGGLVIPDSEDLDEGQPVQLRIHIASQNSAYDLGGRVVRRHTDDRQVIVAFDPGEPHDMLLTAALAETDDVPARRFQRFSVSTPAEINGDSGTGAGRLTDVSAGGCCVRLDASSRNGFTLGAAVTISTQEFQSTGTIVWVRGKDRGVSFDEAGVWAAAQYIESL